MKVPTSLSFLLCVIAGIQHVTAQSTIKSSITICKTKYGSSSVAEVPTKSESFTYSNTVTVTVTSTPIEKVTPPPVTTTVTRKTKTIVTTTRSPLTTTYTSTSTVTSTDTSTAPATTVTETAVTTTTISITSTSTYTGATVTPIYDTVPGAGPAKKKRSRIYGRQSSDTSSNPAAVLSSNPGYPKSVKCSALYFQVIVIVIKTTAPTKTITKRPQTSTSTVFSTYTSTSTVCPPNTFTTITTTSTITSSTTTTPTVTTTITSTATETTIVAIETYYPQCGPRNSANRVNGAAVRGIQPLSDFSSSVVTGGSLTNCCIQCLLDPSCAATSFGQGPGSASTCIFYQRMDGTCDPANPLLFAVGIDPNFQGGARASVQNGKCGVYDRTYNV